MTIEEAIEVLDMFLHKDCSLERTKFAYDENTVWHAVHMGRDALKERNQIVRCKDCVHRPTAGTGANHDVEFPDSDWRCPCRCEDGWYNWIPDDDWFCKNGERRIK